MFSLLLALSAVASAAVAMPPRKNKGPASDALSELKPGDLVWGKVAGYPWWPGQMMPEDLADEHILRRKKPGTLLVAFFGDKSFGAWHGSCERTGVCPACMAWRVVAPPDGRARCCDSDGGSQQGKGSQLGARPSLWVHNQLSQQQGTRISSGIILRRPHLGAWLNTRGVSHPMLLRVQYPIAAVACMRDRAWPRARVLPSALHA